VRLESLLLKATIRRDIKFILFVDIGTAKLMLNIEEEKKPSKFAKAVMLCLARERCSALISAGTRKAPKVSHGFSQSLQINFRVIITNFKFKITVSFLIRSRSIFMNL
jgi:hypothetical protein